MEKKSTPKKSGTKTRKTSTTSSRSRKRKTKKSKVYIPAYKILVLCLGVIAVCMVLLLVTTVSPDIKFPQKTETTAVNKPEKTKKSVPQNSITERFEKSTDSKTQDKTQSIDKTKSDNAEQLAEIAKSQKKKQKTPAAVAENKTSEKSTTSTKTTTETSSSTSAASNSTTQKTTAAQTSKPDTATTENKKPAEPVTVKQNPPVTLDLNKPAKPTESSAAPKAPATPAAPKDKYNFPQAVNNAQLVFVFDDGGQNLSHLEKFLQLPFPITIAVLPKLGNSKASAAKVRASGNELMLHQPMQPLKGGVNPGPGAITTEMSEDEIISTLFQNVTEIGPIAGFNNHEGSAVTADAERMALVMRFASENGVYFLDSRTNVETQVPYVAGELGYSYYERNIFLDNEKTRDNVLKELNKGLTLANKNGVVIMIGHVWSADFLPELLKEIYPELKAKGYTFTVVSKSKGLKY